jgi:DNA-binding NarL/FixJ family response regulator
MGVGGVIGWVEGYATGLWPAAPISRDRDRRVHNILTDTEVRILEGLADGLQSKEIASRIGRSTATVEFHIRSLYMKMLARSRAHLVARAYDQGYLSRRESA